MLESLTVRNLALIKEAEISFGEKINILSGETGAGKSVLINSVNLALGQRSDPGLIRNGEEEAFVELVFYISDPETLEKLRQKSVNPEDNRIIVSRRLTQKKSVSKINGETVPLTYLKEVAPLLIDIYGQNEHQSLLKEGEHLKILDNYGKNIIQNEKTAYTEAFSEYRKLREEIKRLGGDDGERKREIDFLEFQINEIEEAGIKEGEEERLSSEFKTLSELGSMYEGLTKISEIYDSNISEDILNSLRTVQSLSKISKKAAGIEEELSNICFLLDDYKNDVTKLLSECDIDPERYAFLNERIGDINRMKKKYGGSEKEILKTLASLKNRYKELKEFDDNKELILKQAEISKKKLLKASKELHQKRLEAAEAFKEAMVKELKELNFLSVRFETELNETVRFTTDGSDEAQFMISLNPGEDLKPLQKTASGGELSRIMLAIKTLASSSDRTETLIFDEIDTGISGKTAGFVAEKLVKISRDHQILCISHLPQIIASADTHFLIEKNAIDNKTVTDIKLLDEKGSIDELARLLCSGSITETAIENAAEMKKRFRKVTC